MDSLIVSSVVETWFYYTVLVPGAIKVLHFFWSVLYFLELTKKNKHALRKHKCHINVYQDTQSPSTSTSTCSQAILPPHALLITLFGNFLKNTLKVLVHDEVLVGRVLFKPKFFHWFWGSRRSSTNFSFCFQLLFLIADDMSRPFWIYSFQWLIDLEKMRECI